MSGPYYTKAQAWAEPMPQAVRALHAAGRARPGDPDRLIRDTRRDALLTACSAAGVELGGFDRRIVDWLAGWEDSTVQVVIGLVARAHESGRAER